MDYNDNDYEGQNLHLTGEESSKISVLRPFALPKFDFDDSLPGHLRFDSLVENEVFLGIPSQEDNHWIEDFSRGGNVIDFTSSVAESCVLPRHINVWSEATSSESVEMLLKAVGQEEMVPGENIVEESDPGDQLGSSARQMDNNLGDDSKVGVVENPSLSPAEVEGNFSRLNQSAGVEAVQTEHTFQVKETTCYGTGVDNENCSLTMTTENLILGMNQANDKEGETCGSVDRSLSNPMQENLSVIEKETDNTEMASRSINLSIRECVDQDKISDFSFLSSRCMEKGSSGPVEEEEEGCNENDLRLSGISVATNNTERQFCHELPSTLQSQKEEHAIVGELASMPVVGESISTGDGCNKVAVALEPADCGHHSTVPDTETNQLSESHSISHENSVVALQEEGNESFGVKDVDVVTAEFYGDNETEQDRAIDNDDLSPNANSSLDAPPSSLEVRSVGSESSMLPEVVHNPPEKDDDHNIDDRAYGRDNSTSGMVSGESSGEKSLIDDVKDAKCTASMHKKKVEDEDHVPPSSVAGSIREHIASMPVDAPEGNLDVSTHEREGEKLPLDSGKIVCDEIEKEVGSPGPAEIVTVDKTTRLQPDCSTGDYPVLDTDVEDTKLAASNVEGLIESYKQNPPLVHRDQSKVSGFEASEQPSPSIPKESFKSNELAPAIETENITTPVSAVEVQPSHLSVPSLETSNVTMPNEASNELNEKMENSANTSIAQIDGVEVTPTKKPMGAETERKCGTSSCVLPGTICTVEIDKSDMEPTSGASCIDVSQGKVNQEALLKRNNVENICKVLTTSEVSVVNDSPKEEGTFTFDIRHLGGQSAEDSSKDLQSFPRLQASKLSLKTGEGFASVSGSFQTEQTVVNETSHVTSTPGVCPPSGGPPERKSRRGGGSKARKGSSKKGNLVKEASPLKHTEKGDKSPLLLSPSGTGQLMTFESSAKKTKGTVTISTSSLPDLNTSAPSSGFFQQPFTDLQQVQLRAQIFVYGSLIQGAAPDEACMVSAFDGGKSVWERSWRACVDRLHGQKSQGNTGTPVPSRSGAKAPDHPNRQSSSQSEVISSSAGRSSNKAIPSVVNPLIPLSSPLWSLSTPSGEALPPSSVARGAVMDYQAVSPLNPYQTPPMRNYIAHTTWPSQAPPAPFPVPWLSSSQSPPFEISTSYPTFPVTEPVKSSTVKESSLPIASGTKHATPIPATNTGLSAILPGASPIDLKKVKVSTGQAGDTKTRKRKKSSGSEDVPQISVPALSETVPLTAKNPVGSVLIPPIGSYYSTSVAVATPSSLVPKGSTNQAVPVVLPSISGGHLNKCDLSLDKSALKFEGFRKVEEAKLQAEEAAAHAAAAISQCEVVWSQLDLQKSSGLTSDTESKLASAACAIAAAASVAKAAAAAAKIASNAAVQAKQMADEAVTMSGTPNAAAYNRIFAYNSMNLSNTSPASILKGGDPNNAPSLAISAAREAARKRIEAASAATRHAENLDAIVKAAELAAEAVTHAGKVVAMGDPLSLSALAEAGPYNYWKVPQKSQDMSKNKSVSNNAGEMPNVSNQHKEPDLDLHVTGHAASPIQRERSSGVGDHVLLPSVNHGENISNSTKAGFVVSDPETKSRSNLFTGSIEEGSVVEVLKDHADLKKAWISATVMGLKDGEVLVSYEGPQSEGSEPLKEWISIEAKDGEMPKVRVPHPSTAMQFGGTRKRRRAAVKDHSWSVGDKVDAFVQESWCEGIIAEKNNKDATTLNVHFPAQDKTLQVKLWHLRQSLVWSDGQWIEWSRPRQDSTCQGETPVEKRQKLVSTSVETKGKAKMAKSIDFAEKERTEEPRLPLSANEKVFNIGSTKEENKPNMVRTMRPGLEKEGSRVVFGVPKPGKKRKFMEVSKHYVSDRTAKTNVPGDSVKLAKFLMPQGSGSRGYRNNTKLDSKEKQVVESKPRSHKSGKPPSIPSRTLSRKDESTSSRRDAAVSDHSAKGSMSNDENESSERNPTDMEVASAGSRVLPSQAPPQEKRTKAARNARPERLNQGKLAPAGGTSGNDAAAEKLSSEVAEPRRSNRRIQPTSRLLEGLQSSLIISKIPSAHDKGHRSVSKGTARGNNNRG